MTNTPTTVAVTPEPGGRLEQLLAMYDQAKAWADEANARFEAIKDGIKTELAGTAPGVQRVDVNSPDLQKPLRLVYVESFRVDTKRLEAEQPTVYQSYLKPGGSWQLRAVK